MKKVAIVFITLVVAASTAARTITVDNDGPADFNNIQAAIDDANDGDTVEVQPGTYTGPGNGDIDFKGQAITLKSANGPENCIIDCNGTETDRHRGFYFHRGEDANSILEGLTILNGYAPNEPYGPITRSAGGGILCDISSPTIRNCVIKDNYSDYWGGGLWCSESRAVIEDCTFEENEAANAGGGVYNRLGRITVTQCHFVTNYASNGGGMYNFGSDPIVGNSTFTENLAVGNGGAVRNEWAIAKFSNCVFFDNQASNGGAIDIEDTEPTTMKNCIIWGNSTPEIEGPVEVVYCDIRGGWAGAGNIDADPCFADSSSGDYHLKSQAGRYDPNEERWTIDEVTSPCIDAGDPMDPIGPEPFPNGGIVNMGAYGGTGEASKSYFDAPPCETIVAGDINGDCVVDFRDFRLMGLHWLDDYATRVPEFFYYYYDERIYLDLCTELVAIWFAETVTEDQIWAVIGQEPILEGIFEQVDLSGVLGTTREGTNEVDVIKALERLNNLGELEFATPVFLYQDLKLVLTDQFTAKFHEDVTREEIDELNEEYGVAVVSASPYRPNRYVLRVINPKEQSALDMANLYNENPMTEYGSPNFMVLGAFDVK